MKLLARLMLVLFGMHATLAFAGVFADLNSSGEVDAVDVQLVINAALDIPVAFPTDLNTSGATDAVDVQLVINAALDIVPASVNRPFPQHVTYAAGSLIVNSRSQAQLDDDVRAAYDRWKTNYLAQAGVDSNNRPRYRVKFSTAADAPTVSEGQGYGMIIVAHMAGHDTNARTIFDGLWQFVVDHRSENDPRLPDWWVNGDESADTKGDTSAFDGDADVAYALLLADAQWGSTGNVHYRNEALTMLQGILASEIGPDSRLPLLGDWVDPAGDDINQYVTRASDFLIGHFRAYERASGNAVWLQVVSACQAATTLIQTDHSATTGLLPDFLAPTSAIDHTLRPAPPNILEAPTDGMYSYNAGRVPWRIGTDWLLNGNASSRAQAQKISIWVQGATGGDPLEIKPGYQLNGTPIPPADYFTTFFAAPLGIAAMCTPGQLTWLNAVYEAVYTREEGYYEDSVTLLSMLVMTGNFWDPTQ